METDNETNSDNWITDPEVQDLLEERLDEVDYNLIRALNIDGRMTDTELAERLNIARTTVRRRRKQLEEDGLIDIAALIVFQNLGFSYADAHIRFVPNASNNQINDFIANLIDDPQVYEMAEYMGEYDLLIRLWHSSFANIKSHFRTRISKEEIINTYAFHPITRSPKMWFKDFS